MKTTNKNLIKTYAPKITATEKNHQTKYLDVLFVSKISDMFFVDLFGVSCLGKTHTQMLHVWNIYLHDWVIFGVNVGKYSSTMEHLGNSSLSYFGMIL